MFNTDINKILIIQEIRKGDKSIADLSKQLNMKRSTLNYYLNLLRGEGKIESERIQEKVTGRPTMITLTQKYKKQLEHDNKNQTNSIKSILNKLNKSNGIMKKDEFLMLDPSWTDSLLLTIEPKMVEQYVKITSEGKRFLEENKN